MGDRPFRGFQIPLISVNVILAEHFYDTLMALTSTVNESSKVRYPDTVHTVLSGYTDLTTVTEAINDGAVYKFLLKPWNDEQLRANLRGAFQHHEMAMQNRRLNGMLAEANVRLLRLHQPSPCDTDDEENTP